MNLSFEEAAIGSELHRREQDLRDEVLRKPLGRALSAADIEKDREGHHFVALLEDEVVGCVGLYPQSGRTLRMRQMAVSPRLQGQGIGRRLIGHAEDWARSNGFERIELHARMTALGFYERLGYCAQGEVFEEIAIPHKKMWKAL